MKSQDTENNKSSSPRSSHRDEAKRLFREWLLATIEEQASRSAIFAAEQICGHDLGHGIRLPPMRVRHLATLEGISSPFLVGNSEPSYADLYAALIIWAEQELWRVGWFRWKRFVRKINAHIDDIGPKFAEALALEFEDAPMSGQNKRSRVRYWSTVASIMDALASEYGWTPNVIMDLPLRVVWQLQRCIIKRHCPDAILGNPSDSIRARMVEALQPDSN